MTDIQEISAAWARDLPSYQELGFFIKPFLKDKLSEQGLLPEVTFRTKDLVSIIKKVKRKVREKEYSYGHLRDKLGVRIICNYNSELRLIDSVIKDSLDIVGVEYKQQNLNFDKLGYISNHYDLKLKKSEELNEVAHLSELIFELQVRTLNQHAWSNIAHEISYKQEAGIPDNLQRRVYRLLSLYEIADDEFEAVNNSLISNPDNKLFGLIRKLEKYIYRFAQIDYDRETSIHTLRILITFLDDDQLLFIDQNIEAFISENQDKISVIFEENRNRFHEIPFLTQPEVFFVWFALYNYQFAIIDNWESHFDKFELEQLAMIWGKIIE